jgi:hypothetical protein
VTAAGAKAEREGGEGACTLETCGHMRQLDAIVRELGMPRGARSALSEVCRVVEAAGSKEPGSRLLNDVLRLREGAPDSDILKRLATEFAGLPNEDRIVVARRFSSGLLSALMARLADLAFDVNR